MNLYKSNNKILKNILKMYAYILDDTKSFLWMFSNTGIRGINFKKKISNVSLISCFSTYTCAFIDCNWLHLNQTRLWHLGIKIGKKIASPIAVWRTICFIHCYQVMLLYLWKCLTENVSCIATQPEFFR